jgi:hypothetical protein
VKIEIGEKYDFEIERSDIENVREGSIIATYYNMGNPIYVELILNKSLANEIRKFFMHSNKKSALISITRISKLKYRITPTIVILNKQRGALQK